MTGDRVLADTNVLIYLIGGSELAASALQGLSVHISFITEIELKSKRFLTVVEIEGINELLGALSRNDINQAIKDIAAKLRREHGLKLADAIIAATAMHLNVPLLTADNGLQRLGKLLEIRKL